MNAEMAPYTPSPIEGSAPDLELTDPTPHRARAQVRSLLERSTLSTTARHGLIGAVSEVITNAELHGKGHVHLQGWSAPSQVVVTVTDEGPGPPDAAIGDAPMARDPGEGGFGLWLARLLCDEVACGTIADGFAVRLRSWAPRVT